MRHQEFAKLWQTPYFWDGYSERQHQHEKVDFLCGQFSQPLDSPENLKGHPCLKRLTLVRVIWV